MAASSGGYTVPVKVATGSVIKPQTTAELTAGNVRELIMLGGPDGVGKSSAIISLAWWLQTVDPDAKFYLADTENKIKSTLKSFGADAPTNIVYQKCDDIQTLIAFTEYVIAHHRPWDWYAVESLSRVWERAQDHGYQVIEGVTKREYLERKRADKTIKSPIPSPDQFWQIVKGAHDANFFDLLTQQDDLNVIFTTTVAKPKQEYAGRKESADRKAVRVELGINANLEGAPRLPYYIESLMLMDMVNGQVTCRVLRDNNSKLEQTRIEFPVADKKSFGFEFMAQCRG